MCGFIKRIICLVMISLILFTGIAIWGKGGDKFRWLGKKTGGFIRQGSEKLADKADQLRDKAMKRFKGLAGEKNGEDEDENK
ncbi:MAG: hypothetical protein HGA78_07185 [Nitrospirales bacterium]|nr:hypothetical protein [Nitrospirales bacterium]